MDVCAFLFLVVIGEHVHHKNIFTTHWNLIIIAVKVVCVCVCVSTYISLRHPHSAPNRSEDAFVVFCSQQIVFYTIGKLTAHDDFSKFTSI